MMPCCFITVAPQWRRPNTYQTCDRVMPRGGLQVEDELEEDKGEEKVDQEDKII